ncbi:MAG: imidazole glycerol phosphate synthase subunit HisH [Chitinophagales bacterium]|nr:imidazole glycerol phosphate synthase subunit HisH [Chitinophagales bacterium]
MNIALIDYGMGNIHSVKRKMHLLKRDALVSSKPMEIIKCDKIILPGVGHFGKAMENLKRLSLLDALNEFVLVHKKPVLGICLGMQLMAARSEEGNATGLGWFDAEVVRFKVSDSFRYKIPHTGWNSISIKKKSYLMKDVSEGSEVYFVHSYHMVTHKDEYVLNTSHYCYEFVAAVERENIFGVQYHPEKSHRVGLQILKNFIEL